LQSGVGTVEACRCAGITRKTGYRWRFESGGLEPRSYGFRPGRGCHDAIEAIYWTLNGKHAKRQWILDADLSAAFDRLDPKVKKAITQIPEDA